MSDLQSSAAIIITTFLIVWIIGGSILQITNNKNEYAGTEFLIGFSVIIAVLSLSFVFHIHIRNTIYLAVIFIGWIVYKSWINDKKEYKLLTTSKNITCILPIVFSIVVYCLYDEKFIVFRGNIWDWFNYNTMTVAFSKYSFRDLENLLKEGNSLSAIALRNYDQRPSVVSLPAALLSMIPINSYALLFLYKGLILSIYYGVIVKLAKSLGNSFAVSNFFAVVTIFSAWTFYVVEIDALAQLAFLPFVPFGLLYLRGVEKNENKSTDILAGSMMGVGFVIYPEFGSIVVGTMFVAYSYFGYKIRNFDVHKLIRVIVPLLVIILMHYEDSIKFLINQITIGFTAKADWWGYYGAFLLGPYSPVTDPLQVNEIRNAVAINGISHPLVVETLVKYSLYIVPSVFGLFHLAAIKYLLIPLNLIGIVIAVWVIKYLSMKKNDCDAIWLKFLFLSLVSIVLILAARGNFWSATKGLSYILSILPFVIIYIYSSLEYRGLKISILIYFSVAALFPIYKYSIYNDGIGRLDGFPSILHPSHKRDYEWSFFRESFLTCDEVFIDVDNPFKRHFWILNLENYDIEYIVKHEIQESYGFGKILRGEMKRYRDEFEQNCVVSK